MASTTEELTGQSEQLVSALSFFRTSDEDDEPAHRPASKSAKPRPSPVQPALKSTRHAAATGAKNGVSLRMKDRQDDSDGEFERY